MDINGCLGPSAMQFLTFVHNAVKSTNPSFRRSFIRNASVSLAFYRSSILALHSDELHRALPPLAT
jgi:hypothetical protein